MTLWRFGSPQGIERRVRVEPELASNNGEIAKRWALAGLGLIVRSEWDVAENVKAERLVALREDHPRRRRPSWPCSVRAEGRGQRGRRAF